MRFPSKRIINMNRLHLLSPSRFLAIAAVVCFVLLLPQEGLTQCCCPDCPDEFGSGEDCEGIACDYSLCPNCQTAIPLTDHLWILAVLGAAGGAWLLLRNRTAEEVA
jgi:hypothetical protein